ncbi:MAG: acetate--CoA ligase [Nitrospinota bacterium]|nr:acetate--CoA ligase [Nitrospinota bacterium]
MSEGRVFTPSAEISKRAYISSMAEYKKEYQRSISDPEGFWAEKANELDWVKKWDKVRSWDFVSAKIEWFTGGKLNVSANCLDRHVKNGKGEKVAIIWEGDDENKSRKITYKELLAEVNRFALVLKANGVKKGDRVTIYLPMIPELASAMLACTRIGAVHSIVFGGFSADSLKNRIEDCESEVLITADGGYRGGKVVPLKATSDSACQDGSPIKKMIVVRHTGGKVEMKPGRDVWLHEEMAKHPAGSVCEPVAMDAEDPLFILYTSGSTGKPKGVLHTTGGYILFAMQTFKYIFDYHDEDIYWCTADIGWVTGHSYIVYGPMANAATTLMFEGVPTYPDAGRFWKVVDKYKVNTFYTAPTAIRALSVYGEEWPKKYDLSSLRILGSVGEPINPEAWMWYHQNVGRGRCPIVDTWWQTETGGILITPLPGSTPLKPGSATFPFFGVEPEVIKQDGTRAEPNEGGYLVIKKPWPGMMRTVYGHHERFRETYFSQYPGSYFTGDGARVDKDGYYWLMGRVDDVINVSGHRIGTAEVESALVAHSDVGEAAVVGFPHDIKGQGLYAYVTLNNGVNPSPELEKVLRDHVAREIGPIAKPDIVHFTNGLPKTRSGKIMRRILRKIAEGDYGSLGDTSTLADPSVVESLISVRKEKG